MNIIMPIVGLILFVILVLMVASICRRIFNRISDVWNRIDKRF